MFLLLLFLSRRVITFQPLKLLLFFCCSVILTQNPVSKSQLVPLQQLCRGGGVHTHISSLGNLLIQGLCLLLML